MRETAVQKVIKVQLSILTFETKEKIEKDIEWVLNTSKTTVASLHSQELKLPDRER